MVYSASVVTWKSTDGGKTWTGIRGAPGGDDYQKIWINPDHPNILLIVSDQGAIITVNGGETWSSWYNQPTAQMYHAAADNAFPYRVCGGQQESGSACVASRGNDGEITFREWHPVGVEEYGYAAPDPLDPDHRVWRQADALRPAHRASGEYRAQADSNGGFSRAAHRAGDVFSHRSARALFRGEYFMEDARRRPQLAGDQPGPYAQNLGGPGERRQVSRYAHRQANAARRDLCAGAVAAGHQSHLGRHRRRADSRDRGWRRHWKDVTPPQLVPFAKVSILDAGHFDAQTAYAAINTLRLDDMRPHILRTHDGGKTWAEIVNGIPDGAPVDVVREDPKRKGLLYAGTEREVYVSFDDGDHWQSLRLNMPATSIRDLIIKDDDLVAATHSRGFWILDDVTPLRQLDAGGGRSARAFLFQPETAIRVRWDMNTDTPLPPDEPAGQNPPDGAILDYTLGASASGPVTLEVSDSAGKLVRRYSSDDPVEPVDLNTLAIPAYWVRPAHPLSNAPGMHRFLWDMRYTPVREGRGQLRDAGRFSRYSRGQRSAVGDAGRYTVKLTVNGKSYTQPLTVKMDPRVRHRWPI